MPVPRLFGNTARIPGRRTQPQYCPLSPARRKRSQISRLLRFDRIRGAGTSHATGDRERLSRIADRIQNPFRARPARKRTSQFAALQKENVSRTRRQDRNWSGSFLYQGARIYGELTTRAANPAGRTSLDMSSGTRTRDQSVTEFFASAGRADSRRRRSPLAVMSVTFCFSATLGQHPPGPDVGRHDSEHIQASF